MRLHQVYTKRIDSGKFVGAIPCAYIYQLNYSLPFELELEVRVLVHNKIIGSTSSNLLNLTVQVVASNDNQSAFEVLFPSTYSPTMLTLSTNTNTSNNLSSSFGTPNTTSPSDAIPNGTSKSTGSTTQTLLQLSTEESSNSTDLEEKDVADSKRLETITIIAVAVLSSICIFFILVAITGCFYYKKSRRGQQVVQSQHVNSSDESASDQGANEQSRNLNVFADSSKVAESADTSARAEESPASDAYDCLVVSVSNSCSTIGDSTRCEEDKRSPVSNARNEGFVDSQSHECSSTSSSTCALTANNAGVARPADSNAEDEGSVDSPSYDCPNISGELSVYCSCRSSLEEQVDPKGNTFKSGSLRLIVPPGAVFSQVTIGARLLGDAEPMPIAEDWVVLSLTLDLQPHDLSLKVPIIIEFPFTAELGGWMLELMRYCPVTGWTSVLTIDTDIPQVTAKDPHCNYDLETRSLQLSHFCKYRWCGYKNESSSAIEKTIACSIFALMDSSRKSCTFFLYFTHDCDDILDEIAETEDRKGQNGFKFKDKQSISIGMTGQLNITCTVNGFEVSRSSEV
jgi:hypothetical protein